MRQPRDHQPANGWRVGAAPPNPLKHLESRLDRLPLHEIDIPLDHMLETRPTRCQRSLEVLHHLFGLCSNVALPNDRPGCVDGVLPADINSFYRADDDYHVAKGGFPSQTVGAVIFAPPTVARGL